MQCVLECNLEDHAAGVTAESGDVDMSDEGNAWRDGHFLAAQATANARNPSASLGRVYITEANATLRRLQEDMRDTKENIEVYRKTTSCLLNLCEDVLNEYQLNQVNSTTGLVNDEEGQMMVEEWLDIASASIRSLAHEHPIDAFVRWQETKMRVEEVYSTCARWVCRLEGQHTISFSISQVNKFLELSLSEDLFNLANICLSGLLDPNSQYRRLLHLRGSQAQSLANLLYGASELSQDRCTRRRIEKALRKLCGRAGMLPSVFYLSKDDLKQTSPSAVACGGFADIYEGTFGDKKVAMKVLRVFGGDKLIKARESFYKEVIYWKELVHANIVPFVGLADPDILPLCMVSEWMSYGNVLVYLKTFPRANRMNLISDIIAGLYYLHRLGIIHGDMKSGNVLIDDEFRARLADFGLARVTQEPSTMSVMQTSSAVHGSVRWMAPELLEPSNDFDSCSPKLTPETDIYALALVMLEAFTGRIPFYDQPLDAFVVLSVTRGLRPVRPSGAHLRGLSDKVWDLMSECWQRDPGRRPRMEVIRTRFEDERTKFEVPEATSPEECEEVEDMLSTIASDDEMLLDGDESDPEDSFLYQDFTRPRSDTRLMVSSTMHAAREEIVSEIEVNRYQRPDWPRGPRPMPVLRRVMRTDGDQSSVLEGC